MKIKLEQLAEVIGGTLTNDDKQQVPVAGISTDSRSVNRGDVFFALVGENFDGHDFVQTAVEAGARALVVSRPVRADIPVIIVKDTLYALGELARWWRGEFERPVVAIAGSSGKTTVKEMAGEILNRYLDTLVTRGNLNNLIGLPATLFHLTSDHQAAVLELGMNVPDENRRLMEIARPDCVLLTNINHAHIGMFESPRAHYEAEAEPLRYADPKAVLIINQDDPLSRDAYNEFGDGRTCQTFSTMGEADFYAEDIEPLRPFGYRFTLKSAKGQSAEVTLKIFGRHNVSNAVAAAAVAGYYGISLEASAQQLNMFRPRLSRSEVEEIDGYYLVKDYYNAIPAAVISSLLSLADLTIPGRRFAVLGDMMELGEHETRFHEEVADAAVQASLDHLFTFGDRGKIIGNHAKNQGQKTSHFDDLESLANELKQVLKPGDLLLIKGSRSLRLERLYDLLKSTVTVSP